jgi:hypothetical protein
MIKLTLGLLVGLLAGTKAVLGAEKPLYALILGYNKSSDAQLNDLRYADDDAVKNAALMQENGARVWLHTELDPDSGRLYPDVKPRVPTRDAFVQSLAQVKRLMSEDRRAGRTPLLYVFLSGHGDVRQNEGFLYLKDSRLGRNDLLELLSDTPAAAQHLIIDACKSYFMVFRRGPGGKRQTLSGGLEWKHESMLDRTGLFLSTSSDALSHEWETYQAGIFSHQLRSALRGAADLNGDRRVSYKEAAAFIWNADRGIPNAKYRNQFFVYQPREAHLAQAGLWEMKGSPALRIGPEWQGLHYIEDQKGERLVDFHAGRQQILTLMLPERRPLFVRQGRGDAEIRLADRQFLDLGPDAGWSVRRSNARGAEHEAFSQLFSKAFDQAALIDFEGDLRHQLEDRDTFEETSDIRTAVGILAGLGVMTSLGSEWQAREERRSVSSRSSMEEAVHANRKIEQLRTLSSWGAGVALLAAGTYGLWPLGKEDQLLILPNILEPQLTLQSRF